jgi:hypothetical protein
MTKWLFSNNAEATVSTSINTTATTLILASGKGALFPTPTAGTSFKLTHINATNHPDEIVDVTARSGDTLTIVRGREGTSPVNWVAGDQVASLITAEELGAMLQDGTPFVLKSGDTMTGLLNLSGAPTAALHAATKLYTDTQDDLKLNLTGGVITGQVDINAVAVLNVTPTAGNRGNLIPNTLWVDNGYVSKTGDTMTGPLYLNAAGGESFTPPVNDSTTKLCTTAFVKRAIDNAAFPAGTRIVFSQSSAPPGWVQDTSDTANNRMLRVITTFGGATGGINSPIINNFVSEHTHTFTSGNESVNHNHTGQTSPSGTHAHVYTWAIPEKPGIGDGYAVNGNTINETHRAYHTDATQQEGNHAHTFTSSGVSAQHTHSGTTAVNAGSFDWQPRYNNVIICQKS